MKSIPQLPKSVGIAITVIVASVNMSYIVWGHFRESIPLPVYLEYNKILMLAVETGYFIFFPIMLFTRIRPIYKLILILVAIPFCCWYSFLFRNPPERILDSAQLESTNYYATGYFSATDPWSIYTMFKCNHMDLECEELYSGTGPSFLWETELIIDESVGEVHLITHEWVTPNWRFTDGPQPRRIIDQIELDGYSYQLGMFPDYGPDVEEYKYFLFVCKNDFSGCHQLPFLYDGRGASRLEVDHDTREIKVFRYRPLPESLEQDSKYELIFSSGEEPRCFVEGCTIPGE